MSPLTQRLFRPPRVLARIAIRIEGPEGAPTNGFTLDVSPFGCAVSAERGVRTGAAVNVSFTLPGGAVALGRGVVCWDTAAGEISNHPRVGLWLMSAERAYHRFVEQELREANQVPGSSPVNSERTDANARTVLVVEDDARLRLRLAGLLTEQGFHVCTAVTGRDALRTVARLRPPSVIVLDPTLPVLNGRDFLERLRGVSGKAPIVVPTGEKDVPVMAHAARRRVDFDLLVSRIRDCCDAGHGSIAVIDHIGPN